MRSNWQNVSVTNTGDDCEGTIFEASAASLRSPSSSGSWWSHSSKLFLAKRGRPRLKQNLVCCFLKVNKKGFSKFSSQVRSLSYVFTYLIKRRLKKSNFATTYLKFGKVFRIFFINICSCYFCKSSAVLLKYVIFKNSIFCGIITV